jgi:hypothetical protein
LLPTDHRGKQREKHARLKFRRQHGHRHVFASVCVASSARCLAVKLPDRPVVVFEDEL